MAAFVDQIKLEVHAGRGGNGIVAFRREKYVPNGGPAGGDGGRGGSIILRVDAGLSTLTNLRYHRIFKAKNGQNGMGKRMAGAAADDVVIPVPRGTVVRDLDTGQVIGDLVDPGQELMVAKGGRGGRGNVHFVSAKNLAPEIAENGAPGEDRRLELELKILADVGLIGFPSVGKSTLLSVVTRAKPKIAAYAFTTLTPNLGVVRLPDGRDFVMADLPGLINGVSKGAGLGIEFLRHIERTRVLLHLVDLGEQDAETAIEKFHIINTELAAYDPNLLKRPQIVVATKMDLPAATERLAAFRAALAKETTFTTVPSVVAISSVNHTGVQQLIQETAALLAKIPPLPALVSHEPEGTTVYKATFSEKEAPPFTISRDDDGTWVLSGDKLVKLFTMTNFNYQESQLRFAHQLRRMGVDDALRAQGAKAGDSVRIKDLVFEFIQ